MNFEFLKDSKVWIVYSGTTYRLHVTSITFNQAFKQDSYKTKTLHDSFGTYDTSTLFEGSSINTANPANFDFTIPMVDENSAHQHKPIELLLDHDGSDVGIKTFTLYIDPNSSLDYLYKIEDCAITSGTFSIPRTGLMTVSINGQGSKLSRIATSEVTLVDNSYTNTSSTTFGVAKTVDVTINSNTLDNVTGINMEVQNNIEWTKNNTLQSSLSVTNASNSMFPSTFVLKDRIVSGNINQYVSSGAQSNTNLQTWKENIPVHIKAGLSSSNYQLKAELTPCSFTNRVSAGGVFSQAYDFRLLSGAGSLTSLISHYNI
jgi:hypothetical protein